MTVLAAALAVSWVVLSCWRVARPAPGVGRPRNPSLTALVVDEAEADLAVGDVAPDDVVVVVRDPAIVSTSAAIDRLAAELARSEVGAAQPAVRATHTDTLLSRLQDMEWVGLGELHGRRGQVLGAMGSGPTATAYRWSALHAVARWPVRPVDDVRLSAALVANEWTVAFAPGAVMGRQPAASLTHLLRERAEAARGSLGALGVAPRLVRDGRWQATVALLAPVGSLLLGLVLAGAVVAAVLDPSGATRVVIGPGGSHAAVWYLVLFAPAWVAGFTYWTRHEPIGLTRAILLGHLFVPYSLHWVVATWMALLRRHRTDAEAVPS